ncbi:signal peptidase I [Kitasatospora sp. NPDC049285]|uniref:signal peptidase I n=1 Tax=Kitasatospora sp. NPDC049285 TaxID=3157096 RepID=UPI003448A365
MSGLGRAAVIAAVLGVLIAGVGTWYARSGADVRAYTVGGNDMAPAYHKGQRVVLSRIDAGQVRRGDAVVFRARTGPQDGDDSAHFKRVVALGGDHLTQCGGQPLQLNGTPVDEPYLQGRPVNDGRCIDVTVPEGRMYLLGDHRGDSLDSRYWTELPQGTVPLSAVEARDDGASANPLIVGALLALLGVLLLPLSGILALAAWLVRRNARRRPPVGWPAVANQAVPQAGSQPADTP